MTFPFYNPVTVQDPTDDDNPATKVYVDNGLSGKAESGHTHDDRYSMLGHVHSTAAITAGTFDIARIPTGQTSTTVPLGNDSRFTDARTPTSHVHSGADITSGTVPIAAIPTGTSGSTVPLGNDSRFSDARTPTTHAASHASGGSDPVTPAAIGASATGHNHDATYAALSHAHSGADITSGTVPIGRIPTGQTGTTVPLGNDSRFTDARTPTAHVHSGADITTGTVPIAAIPTGQTGSTVPLGNDARFTDARTPTAHVHSGADITTGTVPIGQLPTGTSGTTVALGNHNHSGVYANASHAHSGADITSGTVPIAAIPTGQTGSTVPLGNDSRFTDARTPTAHVHSGADITTGTVPIAAIPTGSSGTTVALGNHNHDATYAALSHNHNASAINAGTLDIARVPTGTSGTTVALGNHNHSGVYVEPNDVKLSVKPWAPVTLTDATTVAVNAALGTHFRLTGTTTRAFGNPTNPTDGQVITFEIKASSGTPNHTWGTAYAFGSDITGTTALVAGKTDYVQFVYASSVSKWQCIGYVKGYTT